MFTALYFCKVLLLLPFIKLTSVFWKRAIPYKDKLFDKLFFGEILLISLEAYFEFLIAGYMNILFKLPQAPYHLKPEGRQRVNPHHIPRHGGGGAS